MSNPNLTFPDQPTASQVRAQELVRSLVDQLNDGATAVLVTGISLASGANVIRHGLKRAPRSVSVSPMANVAWWAPTKPDDQFVYITTASAVTADLQIWI